jgi:hypothetical protein
MAVLRVGVGHASTAREAAEAAMRSTPKPDLTIAFSAFGKDPNESYQTIRSIVGNGAIIGGTSCGELSSVLPGPQSDTIAVMTLQSSYLSIGVGVGENLAGDPRACAEQAAAGAHQSLKSNPTVMSLMAIALDGKKAAEASRLKPFVNLIIPDGSTAQEEPFMRALIRETGTVAQLVGGSTANDFSGTTTYQFGNGVFRNAAVLATISSGLKLGTAMGHPYLPGSSGAVVTRSQGRTVYELNERPATEVMKEIVGVDRLDSEVFARNPFGIKSSDVFSEYTIKSVARHDRDGSLTFFAEIPEGAYLRHMQSDRDHAVASFRATLEQAVSDAGHPKRVGAVIVFNCILRHLLKTRMDICDTSIVRETLGADVPLIGFNTFGEQGTTLGGAVGHYNQTATLLVIGDELISQ